MTAAAVRRRLRPPVPWRLQVARLYAPFVNFSIVGLVGFGWAYAGLTKTSYPGGAWTALWLSVLGAVVLMKVALAAGPVFAGADRMFWVLSSPVPRGALLRPRFFWLLVVGAAVGVGWTAVVSGVVGAVVPPLVAAGVGAACGVVVVAGAVVSQRVRVRPQGWLSGLAGLAVVALLVPPGWFGLPGSWAGAGGGQGPADFEVRPDSVGTRVGEPGSPVGQAGQPGSLSGLVGEPGSLTGLVGHPGSLDALEGDLGSPVGQAGQPGSLSGLVGEPGSLGGWAGVIGAAWVVAIGLAVVAATSLRFLRRSDLAAGGAVAGVARVSVSWFDLALLGAVLAERRARALGRVKSVRLRGPRLVVLAWTDALRLRRSPNAALVWAALLPAPALVSVGWEGAVVPAVHLVAAFLATDRLAAGLKFVCRSPAMRRALGLPDRQLRLAHLVFPAAGAILWCAVTAAFTPHVSAVNALVSAVGAVAVVYRIATRPPVDFGAAVIDFGVFGPTPLGLMAQFSRGPALLAVIGLVQLAL
ncbi:DUF6297 family protein [Lentzea sp. BCCO 10_0798]|uniref:DUF6297 family protein n=1 Tax=Lentzea kristufekii TaxID=3095430 RepID=A0ABU4U141_9PSEU|nr:DUF6297 family protein [Lentzea sp. BCCO 10_0798]MDX8054236.1 DUF6297 family protein [Lentzea sp. BCCO 10_0798]